LFLHYSLTTNKILIYFHGNAEDIGNSKDLLTVVKTYLKINCLAMEYPGYGIYKRRGSSYFSNGSEESSEKTLLEDAHYLMEYLTKVLGIKPSDIILLGRSIGSGPATEMASIYNPSALILISAFTSL
jgi:pimeloyl-ACP methyl ester carboxylesterase